MSSDHAVTYIGERQLIEFDGVWYPSYLINDDKELADIRDSTFGKDDILVSTFPKSGTAWLLRILALIKNDANVEKTDSVTLDKSTHMLEMVKPATALADTEPRIIKSHLNYEHLPRSFREGQSKIICLARNPYDVSVSDYYFHKMLGNCLLDEPFPQFFQRFMTGDISFGPWIKHVRTFWEHRHDAHVLWLTYEDLHQNPEERIREIATFWGKELTDDQVGIIAQASSFSSMKQNPKANYDHLNATGYFDENHSKYMRKGIVGDWKQHFTPEMTSQMKQMIETDITPLGIHFDFE